MTIPKRVMIDFDNTIFDGNGVIEGTKESIDNLKNQGFEIVIYTSRVSRNQPIEFIYNQLIFLSGFLKENNIYYDEITADKHHAWFYIDDLNIRFCNWNQVLKEIKERIPKGVENVS